ncbi:hypothetical protein HAX54_003846 [Datura stramonium]|uniref:Regulator of Vps4 activity in the MVB pathway protein n=1 Tax=Datura stramonium TaxID=4076 RepID=A0ABS8T716_DATST|nr:hypothetical protein [Datura stramonium]
MFAAARFSDLPELRELRDLFQERYGNSLECFVNQKFVEKLSSRPPAVEKRIQLLQDIAVEFSIRWDSMGFQKRMALAQAQPNRSGPSHASAGNDILPNGKDGGSKADNLDIALGERHKGLNDQHNIQNGRGIVFKKEQQDLHSYERKESSKDGNKHLTKQEASYSKGRKHDILFDKEEQIRIRNKEILEKDDNSIGIAKSGSSSHGGRLEGFDNKFTRHNENHGQILTGRAQEDLLSCAGSESTSRGLPFKNEDVSSAWSTAIEKNTVNSTRMVQQEDGNRLMTSYANFVLPPPYIKSKEKAIPPPYVKPNDSKERACKGSKQSASEFDGHFRSSSPCNRVETIKINKEPDLPDHEAQSIKPTRTNSHGHDEEFSHKDVILAKPRSVRRKHHKSATNHGEEGKSEDARAVKKCSSSRRREHSRKGLRILFEDERHQKDEEEIMIDKLLLHYSKRPSKCDAENLRKKPQADLSHLTTPDTGEFSNNQTNRDQDEMESDMVPFPKRSISLPHEQAAPSKATKVFARANSFQPDNQACHVHPKLPDYDDLAARFAALRGR